MQNFLNFPTHRIEIDKYAPFITQSRIRDHKIYELPTNSACVWKLAMLFDLLGVFIKSEISATLTGVFDSRYAVDF